MRRREAAGPRAALEAIDIQTLLLWFRRYAVRLVVLEEGDGGSASCTRRRTQRQR